MEWNIITQKDVAAAQEARAAATEPPAADGADAGAGAPPAAPPGPPAPPPGTPTADDFWNRLMKAIPLVVIGGYLAASGVLTAITDPGRTEKIAFWLVFAFFLVITPLFHSRVLKVTRRRQLWISTVAFALWAFALGGPFDVTFGGWAPWMGSLAVICGAILIWVIDPASQEDAPVPLPVT
jgi:hypothetical protein